MILRYVLSVIFFNSIAYTQIRQRVSVYPRCYLYNTEFKFNDLPIEANSFEPNVTSCADRCKKRDDCYFFTFYNSIKDRDQCFLKNRFATASVNFDEVVSGTKDSESCGNNSKDVIEYFLNIKDYSLCYEHNKVCLGDIYKFHENITSPEVCYWLCFNDGQCIYYFQNEYLCALYRDVYKKKCVRHPNGVMNAISCELQGNAETLTVYRLQMNIFFAYFKSEGFISIILIQFLSTIYLLYRYWMIRKTSSVRKLENSETIAIIVDIIQSLLVYSGLNFNIIFYLGRPNVFSPLPMICAILKTVIHILFNSASIITLAIRQKVKIINQKRDFFMIFITALNGSNVGRISAYVRSLGTLDTAVLYNFSYIRGILSIILSIISIVHKPMDNSFFNFMPLFIEALMVIVNIVNTISLKNFFAFSPSTIDYDKVNYESEDAEKKYNERIERLKPPPSIRIENYI